MNEGSDLGTPLEDGSEHQIYQPSQVISPSTSAAAALDQTPQFSIDPSPAPFVAPAPAAPVDETPPAAIAVESVPAAPEPQTIGTAPFEPLPVEQATPSAQEPITWSASEYIANQKSSGWYLLLGLAAALVGGLIWLLTRDLFPTIAVLIGVILLGVYAGRQPREESYQLDDQGLTIGSRRFAYHEFRSFAVVQDGAALSVELAPLKRFAVDVAMYVAPNEEDQIIDRLSRYLPMEEAQTSLTDNIMRRIKF